MSRSVGSQALGLLLKRGLARGHGEARRGKNRTDGLNEYGKGIQLTAKFESWLSAFSGDKRKGTKDH